MAHTPPRMASAEACRCVFMGTPEFAVPTLERLLTLHHVVGVFTQPDRPAGRGQRVAVAPVKRLAVDHGVPVFQPTSFRKDPTALADLRALAPEVVVVAAYGLILPRAVIDVAPAGVLNVHASLLPRWRGAAPVAHALLAGDPTTGVTIMCIDAGLDTGPILARATVAVEPEDTTAALTARLAAVGADLLVATLPAWLQGEIVPEAQDDTRATLAPRLTRADGWLDWSAPAAVLARRVRAMNPWPGAFTLLDGEVLKVHVALAAGDAPAAAPGTIVALPSGPAVVTDAGVLQLIEVQAAGGRAMGGAEFARGRRGFVGARLPLALPESP